MWQKEFIHTNRGTFECFVKGHGEPICITHLYSQFNEILQIPSRSTFKYIWLI